MHWAATGVLAAGLLISVPQAAAAADPSGPAPAGWVLATGDPGAAAKAPAYLGNGYVGTRVPAAGAGFVAAPVATETHIAGVYADVTDLNHGTPQPQGAVNLPGWTALDFSDGAGTYSLAAGRVLAYHQALDMHAGTITTDVTWASPAGRVTDLRYLVLLDRARARVGTVSLAVRPHWSGSAQVTDRLGDGFDYHPSFISAGLVADTQSVAPAARTARLSVRTTGTNITVAYTDRLRPPAGAAVTGGTAPHQATLTASFPVSNGRWYQVSKVVGMATSLDARAPRAAADGAALGAPDVTTLAGENAAAWAALWTSDIVVPGDPALQSTVHAAQFYLMSSVQDRSGPATTWAPSPVGLSSSGYNDHVFWDAETWMYPSLLAQHPDLAFDVVDYRFRTQDGARHNARATGYQGLRYAWESALDGVEVTPPWAETGALEQHITADVALAQWQYFLATGDRRWLAGKGWPVLRGAADFWASRAARNADGSWSIRQVEGPDEHHFPVDDSAYTNVAAATTLRLAADVAAQLGQPAPASWRTVAAGLIVLPASPANVRPEFRGYTGDQVKQADTVMLTYPWEYPQPRAVDVADLDYYAARYDPSGPAMTDSINSIVAAQVRQGCADWTYTLRSEQPFVVPPYAQFTEARSGSGVFTFLTGEGGFLQEFLYGYPGLRWRQDRLVLAPTLPPQLARGLRLVGLKWQGRVLDVDISRSGSRVVLHSGAPMTVETPTGKQTLRVGAPLTLPTALVGASADAALCQPASATSADPSFPAVGAVDGSAVTGWQPTAVPASLSVRLPGAPRLDTVRLSWAGSGTASYSVSVRSGGEWVAVGSGTAVPGASVAARFASRRVDAVRVDLTSGAATIRLAELSTGPG